MKRAIQNLLLGFVCMVHGLLQAEVAPLASQTISLLIVSGSIDGLGECFEPQLNTGSYIFRIPLKPPPVRGKVQPEVSMTYNAGGGNGPLGEGWTLRVPSIQRQRQKSPCNDGFVEMSPINQKFWRTFFQPGSISCTVENDLAGTKDGKIAKVKPSGSQADEGDFKVKNASQVGIDEQTECTDERDSKTPGCFDTLAFIHEEKNRTLGVEGDLNRLDFTRVEVAKIRWRIAGGALNDDPWRKAIRPLAEGFRCSWMPTFIEYGLGNSDGAVEQRQQIKVLDRGQCRKRGSIADNDHLPVGAVFSKNRAILCNPASSSSTLVPGHTPWAERKSSVSQRDSWPSIWRTWKAESLPLRYPSTASASRAIRDTASAFSPRLAPSSSERVRAICIAGNYPET